MNDQEPAIPIEPDNDANPIEQARRQIEGHLRAMGLQTERPPDEALPPTVYIDGVPIGTVDLFTLKIVEKTRSHSRPLNTKVDITLTIPFVGATCLACGGSGRVEREVSRVECLVTENGRAESVVEDCSRCHGTGLAS